MCFTASLQCISLEPLKSEFPNFVHRTDYETDISRQTEVLQTGSIKKFCIFQEVQEHILLLHC